MVIECKQMALGRSHIKRGSEMGRAGPKGSTFFNATIRLPLACNSLHCRCCFSAGLMQTGGRRSLRWRGRDAPRAAGRLSVSSPKQL